jgi:hypothetical protein
LRTFYLWCSQFPEITIGAIVSQRNSKKKLEKHLLLLMGSGSHYVRSMCGAANSRSCARQSTSPRICSTLELSVHWLSVRLVISGTVRPTLGLAELFLEGLSEMPTDETPESVARQDGFPEGWSKHIGGDEEYYDIWINRYSKRGVTIWKERGDFWYWQPPGGSERRESFSKSDAINAAEEWLKQSER